MEHHWATGLREVWRLVRVVRVDMLSQPHHWLLADYLHLFRFVNWVGDLGIDVDSHQVSHGPEPCTTGCRERYSDDGGTVYLPLGVVLSVSLMGCPEHLMYWQVVGHGDDLVDALLNEAIMCPAAEAPAQLQVLDEGLLWSFRDVDVLPP